MCVGASCFLKGRGDLVELETAEIDPFFVVASVLEKYSDLFVGQYCQIGMGGVEIVVRNIFEGSLPGSPVVTAQLDASVAPARFVVGV